MLARAAKDVSAKIAEVGGAEVCIVDRIANRGIEQRRSGEGIHIQITVNPLVNVTSGHGVRERASARQASGKSARCKAQSQETASCAGIRDGKRRAGLESRDAAEGPMAQQSGFPPGFVLVKRQVVAITHHKAVCAVEVGKATGSVER